MRTKNRITFPKYKITKGNDHKFYWSLYARNGKHLVHSIQGYATKQGCKRSIENFVTRLDKVGKNAFEQETLNIEGAGLYFYVTGKKVRKDGTRKKLAISDQYTSENDTNVAWDILQNGINKGIKATLKVATCNKFD